MTLRTALVAFAFVLVLGAACDAPAATPAPASPALIAAVVSVTLYQSDLRLTGNQIRSGQPHGHGPA